jgi:hypothetical protein
MLICGTNHVHEVPEGVANPSKCPYSGTDSVPKITDAVVSEVGRLALVDLHLIVLLRYPKP